ncbi:MAG: YqzL family protein [Clostridia bacterium]|nr:YqzL family protein [Clostridia bacterium]
MIKKIAWNTFKNTGNVDTFLEFKQIKELEEQKHEQKVEQNGDNKIEWNNNL